jgi:hypothetical protein
MEVPIRTAVSRLLGRTRMLQDGGRGGPSEPAGYFWSGTTSFDQASNTGVTTRQDSSASSALIEEVVDGEDRLLGMEAGQKAVELDRSAQIFAERLLHATMLPGAVPAR